MNRYNNWWTIASGALLGILIGAIAIILIPQDGSEPVSVSPKLELSNSFVPQDTVPNEDVSTTSVPDTSAVEDIEPDIGTPLFMTIPAGTISSVCDDFDNGLWFWDMYQERLTQILAEGTTTPEDDADALMLDMGDEVTFFCPNHMDRLPTELLVPDVLLPGESD